MDDFEEKSEYEYVKMSVMNKIFSAENIKKRVNGYVDEIYCKTNDNRKIRKAYKNQLMSILKKETEITKQNFRMLQKKKPFKIRKQREYKPTPYVLFCREMRKQHPSNELSGKMQELWREKRKQNEEVYKDGDDPW